MQSKPIKEERQILCFPGLPFAIYLEIAAHLRQIEGVEAGLNKQPLQQFDYDQSQIKSIWVEIKEPNSLKKEKLQEILEYYAQIYGDWKTDTVSQ